MNTWHGSGRLTKNPEVRYTQSGLCVCRMTLAVDDGWGDKKKTYFIPITAWGKIAEACGNNLVKGQQVNVEGKLVTDTYEKNGQKKFFTQITAHHIEFGAKPKGAAAPEAQAGSDGLPYDAPDARDEDIPF